MTSPPPKPTIPNPVKFLLGGTSGVCAVLFTQPLDLVKNRMQLSGSRGSAVAAVRAIATGEGFSGFYAGLSAGMARQATYTTTRLGLYTWMLERASLGGPPGFAEKAGLGMAAGAVAAVVGTPTEVALVRMTADGRLPPDQRRGYAHVFNAMARIAKEEGVPALWTGATPTVLRAMVVNAAQLGTYSQAKEWLLSKGSPDGLRTHVAASLVSGFATVSASMPVDIAKTRLQNMRVVDGRPEYRNALDVWAKVVRVEGVAALWTGFTPAFARLGPHTVLVLVFLEQLNAAYFRFVHGIHGGGAPGL